MLPNEAKKGVTLLAMMIDPEYQQEIGLLLNNEGRAKGMSGI